MMDINTRQNVSSLGLVGSGFISSYFFRPEKRHFKNSGFDKWRIQDKIVEECARHHGDLSNSNYTEDLPVSFLKSVNKCKLFTDDMSWCDLEVLEAKGYFKNNKSSRTNSIISEFYKAFADLLS